MRKAGRISNWNDDKGYGFVTPEDGGARAFVHIKSFQPRGHRPADGDLISYALGMDARGRLNASDVRFVARRMDEVPSSPGRRPRRSATLPRAAIGALALLAAVSAWALRFLPAIMPMTYALLSLLSLCCYFLDKRAATRGEQRVSEAFLHLLDIAGGWPGGLIAQQAFRHKTRKVSYQLAFWITVIANVLAVAYLVRSGQFRSLH